MPETRLAKVTPIIAAFTSLLLCLLFFCYSYFENQIFLLSLDDGYIHAQVANNFVKSGLVGLNLGEGSGGSSSLLWTLFLSLLIKMGIDAAIACVIVSSCSLGFVVFALSRLSFQITGEKIALAATVFTVLSGQLITLGLAGMEPLLFTGLLLLGLSMHVSGRYIAMVVFLSLATLVRVEAIFAIIAVTLVDLNSLRSLKDAEHFKKELMKISIRFAFVLVVFGIGFIVIAIISDGVPSTLSGRRWLYGREQEIFYSLGAVISAILEFFIKSMFRLIFAFGPGGSIGIPLGIIWALLVFLFFIAGIVSSFKNIPQARPLLISVLLQCIFTAIVLGFDGHMGRYVSPFWISFPLFALLGYSFILCLLSNNVLVKAYKVLGLVLVIGFVPQLFSWPNWYSETVKHLNTVHLKTAYWVRDNIPKSKEVAAFDVGILSYYSEHNVVDIGGLNGEAMVTAMFNKTVPDLLKEKEIEFVIIPELGALEYGSGKDFLVNIRERLGFREDTLTLIKSFEVTSDNLDYIMASNVAYPVLSIYRLNDAHSSVDGK
jgi:hypothetical protein